MNTLLHAWQVSADDFPAEGSSEEKLWFVVRYAILAPSSHNTQPWRFRIHGNVVEVHADFTRALPVVDPENRELIMSCGAAVFHLRAAIRYLAVEACHNSCFDWVSDQKSNRRRAAQPKRSSSNRTSTPPHTCSLADDRFEFFGIERLHGLRPHIAQGGKLREASENLFFVPAEDENTVARSSRPKLSFNRDSRLFGGLFERERASGGFPDGAGALVRETNQCDISSHNFPFSLCSKKPGQQTRRCLKSDRQQPPGVKQLLSCRLKAADHNFGHPLHQFVTEVVVLLAILAQPGAVEKDRFDRLQRPRIKMPVVRRKQPRPAQHFADADRLNSDRSLVFGVEFE